MNRFYPPSRPFIRSSARPLVSFFLCLSLFLAACGAKQKSAGPAKSSAVDSTPVAPAVLPPLVDVAPAKTQHLEDAAEAVGTIEANEKAQIKPEIAGRIVAMHFDEGENVKKGDILVELDPSKFAQEEDVAEAGVRQIRQSILQQRKQLATARAQIAQAAASIDQARQAVREMFARLDRADAVLERAHQDEARTRALFEKEFKTQDDLEKVTTAVKQAEADRAAVLAGLSTISARKDAIDDHPMVKQAKAELDAARAAEQALLTALGDAADENNSVDVHPAVQHAVSELNLIKARMKDLTLIAPMDGVLSERRVAVGDFVDKAALIFELYDLSTVRIVFQVPERYINKIRIGQSAEARLEPYPDETFRGVIYYIDPAVDEKTRTVLMKMRIPNAARKLKAGLFATVRIDIGDFPSATVIPEESIVPQGGDSFVFVVENGVAHLRQIRIGLRQGGQVQVLSGIKPGDQVVVAGIQKIRDGAPVRVNPGS